MHKQINQTPECIYGHPAFSICIDHQCRKPGFICEEGLLGKSQCALFHENCQKYEWKEIQKIIFDNPNTKSQQFQSLVNKMEDMFMSAIKKIQIEHVKFKTWVKTFGYSGEMMRLFKLINDGNFNTISGSYINPLIMELMSKQKKKMEVPNIVERDIREYSAQIEALLDKTTDFYLKTGKKTNIPSQFTKSISSVSPGAGIMLQSRITQDLHQINSFFENTNIRKATLLYRASEQSFSAKAFHKLCDDYTNTLILIETEFGKVIGGYSPLSWNSSTKHWSQDKSMKSFIFSLNMKESSVEFISVCYCMQS